MFKKFNKVWFAGTLMVLVAGGLATWVMVSSINQIDHAQAKTNGAQKVSLEKNEAVTAIEALSIEDEISSIHGYLNDEVCYGKEVNFNDWENASADITDYAKDLDVMAVQANESGHKKLGGDLKRASELMTRALSAQDVQGLVYAHRIMHDLDVSVNGYSNNDVWDATESGVGDHSFVNNINDYLEVK